MPKHKPTRIANAVAGAFAPMRLPPVRVTEPQPLQLKVTTESGAVVVRVSREVNALGFTVAEARELARLLVIHADALEVASPPPAQPQPENA